MHAVIRETVLRSNEACWYHEVSCVALRRMVKKDQSGVSQSRESTTSAVGCRCARKGSATLLSGFRDVGARLVLCRLMYPYAPGATRAWFAAG